LKRKAGRPCKGQAVTPLEGVSYAFNARLDREAVWFRGRLIMAPVQLTSRILEDGNVPIAFDTAGAEAVRRNRLPYFSAPPGSLTDAYHDGEYWFPAMRHRGRMNAAFSGGHVLTTQGPLRESCWNWEHRSTPLGRP
jgi:prepilin-type processing-associated H-X9-DG protein